MFSIKTGTGTLRRHLFENHADLWISGCDTLHIPITAKEAQSTLTDYRNRQGQPSADNSKQPNLGRKFSQEAFVDAIVEFIVADDQVCPLV